MVESLVDIAYRRLKKKEHYENMHGSGSFERKVLEPYLGKHVTLQGRVAAICLEKGYYRITLRDVIIQGRNLDHINFLLKEDSKYVNWAVEALKYHSVVKVQAAVKRYRSGSRSTYGLADAKKLELVKRGEESPITGDITPYFTQWGTESILHWKPFMVNGFNYYNLSKVSLLKDSDLQYLERLLSCGLRAGLLCNTFAEVNIGKQCTQKGSFTRARIIQEYLKSKGNSEYLNFLQYERTKEEAQLGLEVADLHYFSSIQTNKYIKGLKEKANWVYIPMSNPVFHGTTGVPFVMKMRGSLSFAIIYPSLSADASYFCSRESLKKLFEDFQIPSGARVSVYNPILNRIANIKSEEILND